MSHPVTLRPLPEDLTFCVDELPLLTAQATLPCWEDRRGRRFNRYYHACADAFILCCRQLLPRAEEAYRRALESAGLLPQWHAALTTHITLQREHLVSLRLDRRVTGTPDRMLARQGDVWDLKRGLLLSLPELFPPRAPWRQQLLRHAADQIHDWEAQGVALYHENWQQELRRALHPHHFYLTEEGLCYFFPSGSIAPAIEGIPTFCLAYNAEAGPLPPEML